MIEKTEVESLYRVRPGVFQNENSDQLQAYLKQRDALSNAKNVAHLESEINNIKQDVLNIKNMLTQLIESI